MYINFVLNQYMLLNSPMLYVDKNSVRFTILTICVAMFIYILKCSVISNTERIKCPYCYGETMCASFENNEISLEFSIRNIINFKNVYFGDYNGMEVVVKKMANDNELLTFDISTCRENNQLDECNLGDIASTRNYTELIIDYMNDDIPLLKSFKICSNDAVQILFNYFLQMKPVYIDECTYLKNVWTILKINAEPLVLQLLNAEKNWPIPEYYGACGRFIVVKNCGVPLLETKNLPWLSRAYLVWQLLQTAKNFTFEHPDLYFYLTDVSPDNIVVDKSLKLTFVDLENLVVLHKKSDINSYHKSEVIYEPLGFVFSQEDLCNHSISDHNYYSICRLLLSKSAPYPMMKNGLLHSPPLYITQKHQRLFELIEECSEPKGITNRIQTGDTVMEILTEILSETNNTLFILNS